MIAVKWEAIKKCLKAVLIVLILPQDLTLLMVGGTFVI